MYLCIGCTDTGLLPHEYAEISHLPHDYDSIDNQFGFYDPESETFKIHDYYSIDDPGLFPHDYDSISDSELENCKLIFKLGSESIILVAIIAAWLRKL